ncbi:MAG: DUF6084 family protein [Terriglobales bacterium]
MPDFRFDVVHAAAEAGAMTFRLMVQADGGEPIAGLRLRAQLSICAQLRRYTAAEAQALDDLFGPPARWNLTLGPVPWCEAALLAEEMGAGGEDAPPAGSREEAAITGAKAPATVPRPRWTALLRAPVEAESGAEKYFRALAGGGAPLRLAFRGTVQYQDGEGHRVAPVRWDAEARFQLPAALGWQAVARAAQPRPAGWPEARHGL